MKFETLGKNCYKITVATETEGMVEFFFSYDTCVAVSVLDGTSGTLSKCRIFPSPSRTTTRHLKHMGVQDWHCATPGVIANHLAVSKLKY